MGKIFEVKIDRFDGGIKNDPRDPSENTCRVVTNFDILTNPRKMTPYRDSESGDSSASTSQKQNFCVGLWTGTNPDVYRLFSLGVVSGGGLAEILMKDLTTGASDDLDDATWASSSYNASASGATAFDLFVFYQKTGLIYGARAGTNIWAFDPVGGAAFADTHAALTYTNIRQGLVHSKDDILYIPYYYDGVSVAANIVSAIASKNGTGGISATALSLPKQFRANSICEKGNFLAIGLENVSGVGNSRVFLWDMDSMLATFSETVDIGDGNVKVLEDLNGELVSISLSGANSSRFKDKVYFRVVTSTGYEEIAVLEGGTSTVLSSQKQKINNRLYFLMSISLNGAVREGVWSVGRNSEGLWTIVHERTPNNDTALTNGALKGFFFVGDFLFIASTNNAGTYQLLKTNNSESLTATSIYESKIFDNGDASLKKKLLGFSIITEPLDDSPAAQVVVKYKIDNETSFTTFLTHDTDGAISDAAVNIESSGASLPEYKEIQFRIESTNGAVITGFSFKSEVTGRRSYN